MFPAFSELCESADRVLEAANLPENGDAYALAVRDSKVAFAVFPHPCDPEAYGVKVVKGEWTDGTAPEDWVCLYCAAVDHAEAIENTFGQVGLTMSMEEAAERYHELAKRSAIEFEARNSSQ